MDLIKYLENNPSSLLDENKIRAILSDVYRNDNSKVNLLMIVYGKKIVESICESYPSIKLERNRYIKILKDDYSIIENMAIWAVDTWYSIITKETILRLKKIQEEKVEYQQLINQQQELDLINNNKDDDLNYELRTRGEETSFFINPTLIERKDRIYVPCGIGNTDNGFFIYGIKKVDLCTNKYANIYALVYNYLIRTTFIIDEDIPQYIKNKKTIYDIDYRSVFRLSIVLLQMIKNNYAKDNELSIFFIGDKNILKLSIGLIDHYCALFCRLIGITEIKTKVLIKKSSTLVDINSSSGIHYKDNDEVTSNARELWYGRKINYNFTKNNLKDLEYILGEISSYNYFKEGQFETLCKMVSSKKNSVCIMPTGSGKSLIYYMISILQPLPILIVSPTDILIKDQIRNLKELHHIENVAHLQLDDDVNFQDFEMRNSLNYLTPETLQNRNLLVKFRYINNGIVTRLEKTSKGNIYREHKLSSLPLLSFIVLDEIHCLSNWGHNFRPEYLMLSRNLNKQLDQISFLGFTATANYTVVDDIQKQLNIPLENFIAPISFDKHNISYDYRCVQTEKEMLSTVKSICDTAIEMNERTIVFTKNDEISWQVADEIGYEAAVFTSDDANAYYDFVDEKCKILVACEDLGIGINFPNIRNIVHYGFPLSKSEYVQEVGRAGRASERVCSYVIYLDGNSKNIPTELLNRNTLVEDIPSLIEGLTNDYSNIYRKLTNDFINKNQLLDEIISMYKDFSERDKPLYVETYKNSEIISIKQKLYMLFVMGFINDWYSYRKGKEKDSTDILIDIMSSGADKYRNDPKLMLNRMKQRTRNYFDNMGNNRASIAKTDRAKTVEDIFNIYIDWYFIKYLYHHNEEFLDLYEFITTNADSDNEVITDGIKDYFSLPFVTLKCDEEMYNEMSIQQIEGKIKSGISVSTIANIERIISKRYSYKLDYLLLLSNLRYKDIFEIGRFKRVLRYVSNDEINMISDGFVNFYDICDIKGRIELLNYIKKGDSNINYSFDEFLDKVYKNKNKDIIYYGILSNRINKIFEKSRR